MSRLDASIVSIKIIRFKQNNPPRSHLLDFTMYDTIISVNRIRDLTDLKYKKLRTNLQDRQPGIQCNTT